MKPRTKHKFYLIINPITVLPSTAFLMEAKNFKLGAGDPSLNLYINTKWSKTKYLGAVANISYRPK